MQVGVPGVAVAHESLVVATARAHGAGPTGVAIVLGSDIAPAKKIALLFAVDPTGDMTDRVAIGIDKTVARCDVAGRPDTYQTKTRATWMRLADALVEFSQRIAHV
jgi:hypothetical protein